MRHYLHDDNNCPTAKRLLNDAPEGYVPSTTNITCKHCLKFINHMEPTMTTIDLRNAPQEIKYRDTLAFDVRLVIEGGENRSTGYGLGVVPTGAEGRQVMHGPMVPGPWAFAFGLATVIAAGGRGTHADKEREAIEGRLIHCAAGDVLILTDDLTVRVELDRRGYPTLRKLEEDAS